MKKKIGIVIGIFFSALVAVVAAIAIYLFVVSDTIELTMIPAPDIQEQLDVYVEAGLCWRAYLNEDETAAVIHLTKNQREKWIEWITDSMNRSLESVNRSENIEYVVSEEGKVLTLKANENMNYNSAGTYLFILLYDLEIYQVLMGEENWSIHFVLEDMDRKEILYMADYPEEQSSASGCRPPPSPRRNSSPVSEPHRFWCS